MHTESLLNDVFLIYNSDLSGLSIIKSGDKEIEFDMKDMATFIVERIIEDVNIKFINDVMKRTHIDTIDITRVTDEDDKVSIKTNTRISLKNKR